MIFTKHLLWIFFILLMTSCSTHKVQKIEQGWRRSCRNKICLFVHQSSKDFSETFEVKSEIEFPVTFTLSVEFAQTSSIPHINKAEITKIIPPFTKTDLLVINPQTPKEDMVLNFLYWWNIGKPNQSHNDFSIYRLPFATGVKVITVPSQEGPKFSLDWPIEEGTDIYAARAGVVIDLKNNSSIGGANSAFSEDANFIHILHNDGSRARYVHLQKNSIIVKTGDVIQEGQYIAKTGRTGFLLKPKLHFVVEKIIDGRLSESLPIKFKSKEKKISFPLLGETLTVID